MLKAIFKCSSCIPTVHLSGCLLVNMTEQVTGSITPCLFFLGVGALAGRYHVHATYKLQTLRGLT
jgi:hypothetical protein